MPCNFRRTTAGNKPVAKRTQSGRSLGLLSILLADFPTRASSFALGSDPGVGSRLEADDQQFPEQKAGHAEKVPKPHDAEKDAEGLRKAMKGLGTDEKAVIDIVGVRTGAELREIGAKFKTLYGRDILEDLKSELSGNFRDAVLYRFYTPNHFDATSFHLAISGAGTDEDALLEILVSRNNEQLKEIRAEYQTHFKKDLEKDIIGDTSGDFKRLCVSLLNGHRDESQEVDLAKAAKEAHELYNAGEGKIGTDEEKFNQIFAARSFAQLRATFDEYSKISKKDIEKAVDSEMSGYLRKGMLAIIKIARNRPNYFAELLYNTMHGAGTNDRSLVRLVITRCEIDLVEIKAAFQAKYGKSLKNWIEGDTSGDYKKLLLKLIGE